MFSNKVFLLMVRFYVAKAAHARNSGDIHDEYAALQGAVLLAFLFHCPDRCCDVTDRRWGDVRILTTTSTLGSHKHIVMDLGIHKTAAASDKSRTVVLRATNDCGCPVTLFRALHGAHGRLFAASEPYPGPILRTPLSMPPRKGMATSRGGEAQCMSFKVAQRLMKTAMDAAQLQDHFECRIHSFRASGAWDALQRGEPPEEVLHKHNWSSADMLTYYTQLRTLYCTTSTGTVVAQPTGPAYATPSAL
jgi:integrase